ncbi:hypothetical protein [Effusibacillus consociatus]|uniref:Uncharacterized protein n=1 Tax=Effusibacillus consociatus TaxID=1117041 RepID=A0ABV9Q1R8_9BACL
MQSNVYFMSLAMTSNDVEYRLTKISRELDKIDTSLNHLQAETSFLLREIENKLAIQNLSQAI